MSKDSAAITVDQLVYSVDVGPDTTELAIGDTARFSATPLDENGFIVGSRMNHEKSDQYRTDSDLDVNNNFDEPPPF